MQACEHEAKRSQPAWQQQKALLCHVDAKVCGTVRAERRGGAWRDEVLGCVQ